jgi:hypothetical protein
MCEGTLHAENRRQCDTGEWRNQRGLQASPDGNKLYLLNSWRPSNVQPFDIVNNQWGAPIVRPGLTSTPHSSNMLCISPDGQWVYLESKNKVFNNNGQNQIYLNGQWVA